MQGFRPIQYLLFHLLRLLCCCGMLVGLLGCHPNKYDTVDAEVARFETTDDSELFFKNLRQIEYTMQVHPQSKFEQYRMTNTAQMQDTATPFVGLCIVFNWRADQAYIFVEPNAFFTQNQLTVYYTTANVVKDSILYSVSGKELQYGFATKLYNHILLKNSMWVEKNGQKFPLFSSEEDKEIFRRTMADFYQLVNVH